MIVRSVCDDETSPLGEAFTKLKAAIRAAAMAEAASEYSEKITANRVRKLWDAADTAEYAFRLELAYVARSLVQEKEPWPLHVAL